jgi:molecular chaperone GrpE
MTAPGQDQEPELIIVDKRRINAEGSEVLAAPEPPAAQLPDGTNYLEDLLRVKAEFDNYRKRVERDRVEWATQAQARLVGGLLGVLDDVERARSHGELDPGFRAVADTLEKVLGSAGLERFGAEGDGFDPARHEALVHSQSAEVQAETVREVYRAGYTFSGRVLRPAQVVVVGPAEPDSESPTTGIPEP